MEKIYIEVSDTGANGRVSNKPFLARDGYQIWELVDTKRAITEYYFCHDLDHCYGDIQFYRNCNGQIKTRLDDGLDDFRGLLDLKANAFFDQTKDIEHEISTHKDIIAQLQKSLAEHEKALALVKAKRT